MVVGQLGGSASSDLDGGKGDALRFFGLASTSPAQDVISGPFISTNPLNQHMSSILATVSGSYVLRYRLDATGHVRGQGGGKSLSRTSVVLIEVGSNLIYVA